jgi:hypothetical protein
MPHPAACAKAMKAGRRIVGVLLPARRLEILGEH